MMPEAISERKATAREFKALAHPLRLRLIELLREGPSTATRLAAALGESSGLTSYHLRVLAEAGLIEDVEEAGNGRERWWRRCEQLIVMEPTADEPDSIDAAATVRGIFLARDDEALTAYLAREEELNPAWRSAAFVGSWYVRLTPEEAHELGRHIMRLIDRYRRGPDARPADASRAIVTFRALPLLE